MKLRPLLFLFFLLLIPVFTFAQGEPQGGQNTLLPEINPQDIEIRSEFKARFPGLRRQPILGFNPKPRVYQIDPNRMPFLESREEAVADISVTQLGRPEPPARTKLNMPDRINAYMRGGFGSYLTPEVEGYGLYALDEKSILSADLNLRASDGHLENEESGFRFLDFNTQYYQKTNDKWRLLVEAGALSDYHYLFNPIGLSETPDKENLGASAKVTIKKIENSFTGIEAALGGSVFESDLGVAGAPLSSSLTGGSLSEKTYFASFSKYWAGPRIYETFNITGSVRGASYTEAISQSNDWVDVKAAAEYERLFNFTTRISGSAGIEYISDAVSEKFYLVPEIEIKHNLTNALTITGKAFATPEMQTAQDHQQYNRFLNVPTQLRHSYNVGLSGEAAYQLFEGNRFFGGVNYQFVRDFAYYQRTTLAATTSLGFYDVNYQNANIFEVYAGASQQLVPEKFWANANVYLRSPKLKSGGEIPYEEKLGIEGAISYKPIKALTIDGWAEYIGNRESPETNSTLNAFVLLNAGAEYQITQTFGVYAKLLNILGQEYEIWDGYQERPFQIFGGLTIKL